MRVSTKQQEIIKALAEKAFGENTHVYIFGSRVEDHKKGGDIDLFITNKNKNNLTLKAKIRFLSSLKYAIGDQKIDVVLDTKATRLKKSFYRSIKKDAVEI